MIEPSIIINGHACGVGEAMTLRVALESFAMTLAADGLGEDEPGRKMVEAYESAIRRIRLKMYGEAPRGDKV